MYGHKESCGKGSRLPEVGEREATGESFSDVIERILEKRRSLLPLWGALAKSRSFALGEDDYSEIRKRTKVRA
jgi:predicted CopG family antitoxin